MASNTLSPNAKQCDSLPSGKQKRVREPDLHRMQSAVLTFAMQRARSAVKANIRGQGLRLSDFSAREITERAEAYFAQHMEPLIAEAVKMITTEPQFARWRCADLLSDAHLEKVRKSITSRVQNSSAEGRANQ